MALYKLTGVDDTQSLEVDAHWAEQSFLKMVNMNLFSMKDLLTQNLSVTNGTFKDWYIAQGYNFQTLVYILESHQ